MRRCTAEPAEILYTGHRAAVTRLVTETRLVASEQEALEEVEDAIDRIFDGSYGICQETKKPIKKTRLKVVPFTRFSLEGQNQFEQRKTKEQDSGSGAFATISDSTMGVEE